MPGIAAGTALAMTAIAGIIIFGNVREYFDWVETPAALDARLPGVYHEDFDRFQQLEREAAKTGSGSFPWAGWCEEQRASMTGPALCAPGTTEGLCCSTVIGFHDRRLEDAALERDEQRLADLADLEAALLAYRAKYGRFPDTSSEFQPLCKYPQLHAGCALEEFLQPLPKEPAWVQQFGYWYRSNGQSYTLYAALEGKRADVPLCASAPDEMRNASFPYCLSGP